MTTSRRGSSQRACLQDVPCRPLMPERESGRPERIAGRHRLRKASDFVLYRSQDHYCGPGPGIAVLPDGEIVVAFRRSPFNEWTHGHPEVEACLLRSKDQGVTWSAPEVFDSGPITTRT